MKMGLARLEPPPLPGNVAAHRHMDRIVFEGNYRIDFHDSEGEWKP